MKCGKHTARKLDEIVHPPTARDMRHIVVALIEDNNITRARAVTEVMLGHHTKADGTDEFYYWLGVSVTLRAVDDAAYQRRRDRENAKWGRAGRAVRS